MPAELDQLQRVFGGRHVRPLHVTLDRCDPRERTAALIAALEDIRPALRRVTITATEPVAPFASAFRGESVLKLAISAGEELLHNRALVGSALRSSGLNSVYGEDHWWAVTVLEGIDESTSGPGNTLFPLDLFVAGRLVLSRIERAHEYTTLYEADLVGVG